MATRGHVGGLAGAAFEAIVLLESSGKNFILVETVGAGQDEVEVVAAVDVTVVVLAPGLGDELQASKAGLMEVGDVLVVNKADRDGAALLAEELHAHGDGIPVVKTRALTGEGVEELFETIGRVEGPRRLMEAWLWNLVHELTQSRISPAVWADALQRISERTLTPYDAAEEILESMRA